MSTLYKYRIRCMTENAWKEVWGESAQAVCPSDASHQVDADSLTILNTFSNKIIDARIKQWDLIPPEQANLREAGFQIPVVPGDSKITEYVLSYPYVIDVVGGFVRYDQAVIGDCIDVMGTPLGNVPVGVLLADVPVGANKLNVSDTAYAILGKGMFVVFGEEEYEITAMKLEGSELTLRVPISSAKVAGTPIKVCKKFMENRWVWPNSEVQLNSMVFDAAGLNTNEQIIVRYKHKNPPSQAGSIWGIMVYRY